MKITYTPNPLNTIVELDEHEKKQLWYKIKIAEMNELLSMADIYLSEGQYFNIDEARKQVDATYYESEDEDKKSKIDEHCDMLLEYYIAELQGAHFGDCTCVSTSCLKCHALALLGIDTTPGLNKYIGNKIDGAFTNKQGDKYIEVSLNEAIQKLSKFSIDPSKYDTEGWKKIGGYEQYIPRWKAEQQQSYDWLVKYKEEHFKE